MKNVSRFRDPESPEDHFAELLRELRRIRELLNEGIGTYLNAKFPYGKPNDRWGRR